MTALQRLAVLSGLISQVRQAQAGAERARIAGVERDLASPVLTAPPDGADPATAAQHARWAAARRAALVRELAEARSALAERSAAARRALGVDGAVTRLGDRAAEEARRKAQRD